MGKGSDQRPVNKRKFDSNFKNIFGERDPTWYQRDKSIPKGPDEAGDSPHEQHDTKSI